MPIQNFSQVVVIESLRTDELRTGRNIFDEIDTLINAFGFPLSRRLEVVSTRHELFVVLDRILDDAKHGHMPIVHIDAHGDDKGMELANGTYVPWGDLKQKFIEINVASRCHLYLILSMCQGGHIMQIIDLTDRAPAWAMIGPMTVTKAGDLQKGFSEFYKTLFTTMSGDKAIKALFDANPSTPYLFTPAEGMLKTTYANYLRDCDNPKLIRERARRLSRKMAETHVHAGVGRMIRIINRMRKPAFEKYRKQFFMIDLYPENNARFSVTYEDVECFSRESAKRGRKQ